MQTMSSVFQWRPKHDMYLLHCAIFASPDSQLKQLAGRVIDASGIAGQTPKDNGELYASAWSGMLKYWILGDCELAAQQFEIALKAYRHPSFKATSKPLVGPWLKGDWKAFRKAQSKDFEKLWECADRNRAIRSMDGKVSDVDIEDLRSLEQIWCWAHCGLALLAHRDGAEVATEEFWFPPHALNCRELK